MQKYGVYYLWTRYKGTDVMIAEMDVEKSSDSYWKILSITRDIVGSWTTSNSLQRHVWKNMLFDSLQSAIAYVIQLLQKNLEVDEGEVETLLEELAIRRARIANEQMRIDELQLDLETA